MAHGEAGAVVPTTLPIDIFVPIPPLRNMRGPQIKAGSATRTIKATRSWRRERLPRRIRNRGEAIRVKASARGINIPSGRTR